MVGFGSLSHGRGGMTRGDGWWPWFWLAAMDLGGGCQWRGGVSIGAAAQRPELPAALSGPPLDGAAPALSGCVCRQRAGDAD